MKRIEFETLNRDASGVLICLEIDKSAYYWVITIALLIANFQIYVEKDSYDIYWSKVYISFTIFIPFWRAFDFRITYKLKEPPI